MSHLLWDMEGEFTATAAAESLCPERVKCLYFGTTNFCLISITMNLGEIKTQPSEGSLEWRHLPVFLLAIKNECTQAYPSTQWKSHLHTLILAQAVDDFDDEVLGNLEVLQADALRAVQHEEEVDGTAGALCSKAQERRGLRFLSEQLAQSGRFCREAYQSKQLMSAVSPDQVGACVLSTRKAQRKIKRQNGCIGDLRVSLLIFPFSFCSVPLIRHVAFPSCKYP